uniref:Uncharacterized protein n=1 Tax=Anguilla anguilla TaxID=7936 RepID=A0A0E9W0J5_ANGAN
MRITGALSQLEP